MEYGVQLSHRTDGIECREFRRFGRWACPKTPRRTGLQGRPKTPQSNRPAIGEKRISRLQYDTPSLYHGDKMSRLASRPN